MFGRYLFIDHRGLVTIFCPHMHHCIMLIYTYQSCLYFVCRIYVYILCTVPMHIIIYKYYNDNLQDPNVSSKTFELFFLGGASQVDHFLKKKHCRVEMLPGQAVSNGWIFCFWGGREILLSKQKPETPPLWSNKKVFWRLEPTSRTWTNVT